MEGRTSDQPHQGGSAEREAELQTEEGEHETELPGQTEDESDLISSSPRSVASFASARDRLSFNSSVPSSRLSSFSRDDDVEFEIIVGSAIRRRVVHREMEEVPHPGWMPSPFHRMFQYRRSPPASNESTSESPAPIDEGQLVPSDYMGIISRAVSPVRYSSMEQLYQRLCEPILIDEGLKMAWLESSTGKKCYMLSARALGITWGQDTRYWRWRPMNDARFPEVAELLMVCWLEIGARISSRDLSPGTRYGMYLVMRLTDSAYGLEDPPQETVLSVSGLRSSTRRVQLQGGLRRVYPGGDDVRVPRARGDGWMELEMADTFIDSGRRRGSLEVKLMGIARMNWKSGLIVHGVEVRPLPQNYFAAPDSGAGE